MSDTLVDIKPTMTMEEILGLVPAAHRALFTRYHVGGCSSCGYEPADTLEKVCKDHNILDIPDVLRTIQNAHTLDQNMQVDPSEVKGWQDAGEGLRLVDVRTPEEWGQVSVPGAELMDYDDSDKYMQLPKETRMVFLCTDGDRSMNVASYFLGHGFTSVRVVRGGLHSWRDQVDPSLVIPEPAAPE